MNRACFPVRAFSPRILVAFVLCSTGVLLAVLGGKDDIYTPSGSSMTAESCNGRDDNGNGQIDEGLGTFSSGLGVCRTTVPACSNGTLGVAVPGNPTSVNDTTPDGVDDNCNGAVDEDAICVHVALTGNDTTGNGTVAFPFRTIQAAINFSAANMSAPKRICVAAGAACGVTGTYAENVTMSNGISVYGGYESVGGTRCGNSTTRIQASIAAGVLFPASVVDPTVLFGFTVDRATFATTSAVTVDGAHNVLLSSLLVGNTPNIQHSYGINIINGGQATIALSRVQGGAGTVETIGVRAVNSQAIISGNCLSLNTTGQCDDFAGASNPAIIGRLTTGTGESYAVLLDNSPFSIVETSSLSANMSDIGAMVRIKGNGAGIVVRANTIFASGGTQDSHGIWAEDCNDASPWLVGNFQIIAGGIGTMTRVNAVRAIGSCHPVVDGNVQIASNLEGQAGGVGVYCGRNASQVGSECVVDHNTSIRAGGSSSATGILCEDGSCGRIERNTISNARGTQAIGVSLGKTAVRVEGNMIAAGCGSATNIGLLTNGSTARIANNFISGWSFGTSCTMPLSSKGLVVLNSADPGEVDIHSNTIVALGPNITCISVGLEVDVSPGSPPSSGKGIFRNNIIHGGVCNNRYGVRESNPAADPRVFENNDIVPAGATTALYYNENSTALTTAAQVNALSDMTVANTVAVDPLFVSYPGNLHLQSGSPVRDAGTSQGVPAIDFDLELRDPVTPDIGADEFAGIVAPLFAVSRKTHGATGAFDVNLPLSGNAGLECRSGGANGDHQLVLAFPSGVTVTGMPQAQVTSGTGQIGTGGVSNGGTVTVSGSSVTVPLTNVTNAQAIAVTLFGVSNGMNSNNVNIPMRVLLGDTTANASVNASDVSQTKGQLGQTVTNSNFRTDVNANGTLNASDVAIVKSAVGTSIP